MTASPRQWATIDSMPEAVFNFQLFNVGSYLYAVGGSLNSGSTSFTKKVHRYSIASNTWQSTYLTLDMTLAYYCGVTYNQKIYVVGGKRSVIW